MASSASVTLIADRAVETLRRASLDLGPGLSGQQIAGIEAKYGFTFHPDHAGVLRQVTPEGWLDWLGNEQTVLDRLNLPVEGTVFDVEENGFWLPEWGVRPRGMADEVMVARGHLATVPRLVPIVGHHRYLPAAPAPSGSPVFDRRKA